METKSIEVRDKHKREYFDLKHAVAHITTMPLPRQVTLWFNDIVVKDTVIYGGFAIDDVNEESDRADLLKFIKEIEDEKQKKFLKKSIEDRKKMPEVPTYWKITMNYPKPDPPNPYTTKINM